MASQTTGKFNRLTNRGTRVCNICGKRRQEGNIEWGTGLCFPCYEEAGFENEHQDGYHDDAPVPADCPMCREAVAVDMASQHERGEHIGSTRTDSCAACKAMYSPPAGSKPRRELRPYQVWLQTVSMDTVIETTDYTEILGCTAQTAWQRWAAAYQKPMTAQQAWNKMDKAEKAALLATYKGIDAEWEAIRAAVDAEDAADAAAVAVAS
jgi:hypothetical protein